MDYAKFQAKCLALIEKAQENISVEFYNEDGRFIAVFSNGVRIVGNSRCLSLRVLWGSGHSAIARI